MLTAAGQAGACVRAAGRGFVAHAATIERFCIRGFVKPKEKSRSAVDVPVRCLSFREPGSLSRDVRGLVEADKSHSRKPVPRRGF